LVEPAGFELAMVWEAGAREPAAMGAAVWIPADRADAWEEAQRHDRSVHAQTDDGGRRDDAFWTWVNSMISGEPAWHLAPWVSSPSSMARAIGAAMIDLPLAREAQPGRA
jgi:hypothetical protein